MLVSKPSPNAGQVGGAADHDPLVGAVVATSPPPARPRARRSGCGRPARTRRAAAPAGRPRRPAARRDRPVEPGAEVGDGVLGERLGQLDDPLLHAAGGEDQHQQQPGAAERHHLDVPHGRARQRRVLHHRDLAGQLGEQPDAALDDVVEVDGPLEQRGDRPLLGGRERLDRAQPVDEQPVALVGGDPARAGVRLGDEPLLLQRGHVVAHGGRGSRRAGAGRRGPWSRPAPGWRRSPRRWRGARRACGPRP